jgi:hypothetical protein
VQGKGVKPVLCEVGGHNLNCCNLLLQVLSPLCNLGRGPLTHASGFQGMSKLEEPIIEKKGRAQDLVIEGGNAPAAFNILLCPQQYEPIQARTGAKHGGSTSRLRLHKRRNPADVLELAADSDSDMQRWLAFFRSLYTVQHPCT